MCVCEKEKGVATEMGEKQGKNQGRVWMGEVKQGVARLKRALGATMGRREREREGYDDDDDDDVNRPPGQPAHNGGRETRSFVTFPVVKFDTQVT